MNTESDWMRALGYAAIATVAVANVLGNIFMKLGSSPAQKNAFIFGVFGWQTLVGIGFFAAGILLYALALRLLPLYIVQAVAALQYVGVILAATIVFGEVISARQWIGVAFIVAGLGVVTW